VAGGERQQEDIKIALAGGKTTKKEKALQGDCNGFDTGFRARGAVFTKRAPPIAELRPARSSEKQGLSRLSKSRQFYL
jgi:hypothetical protein